MSVIQGIVLENAPTTKTSIDVELVVTRLSRCRYILKTAREKISALDHNRAPSSGYAFGYDSALREVIDILDELINDPNA